MGSGRVMWKFWIIFCIVTAGVCLLPAFVESAYLIRLITMVIFWIGSVLGKKKLTTAWPAS